LPPLQAALLSLRATMTLTNGSRFPIGFVRLSALCVGDTAATGLTAGFAGLTDFAVLAFGAGLGATVLAAFTGATLFIGAGFATGAGFPTGAAFATGFAMGFVFAAAGAICEAGLAAVVVVLAAGFFVVAAGLGLAACAQDIPAASTTIEMVLVTFIACLPYRAGAPGFAGPVGAGASWLKKVVAVKLETTLSEGEYLNDLFTFASLGLAVVDTFMLLMLMMRSSFCTRSKKFKTE
jgi:hypothetical protein